MLWPEVRNQAARDLDVHWKFFDSGLSPSREPAGARSAHKLNITKFFTRSSVDKALLPHQRHGTQTRPVLSGDRTRIVSQQGGRAGQKRCGARKAFHPEL